MRVTKEAHRKLRERSKPTGESGVAAATRPSHLVDCNAYGKELVEYPTISAALSDNRIVSVTKGEDGRFCVKECCDNYFLGYLTSEQLLAWADELRALAAPNAGSDAPPAKDL